MGFVVFTIGEKSYTVVYQKYMKENVVSSEISIQNKAEMSFQMKRHRTYFRTRAKLKDYPEISEIETPFWEADLYQEKKNQGTIAQMKISLKFTI